MKTDFKVVTVALKPTVTWTVSRAGIVSGTDLWWTYTSCSAKNDIRNLLCVSRKKKASESYGSSKPGTKLKKICSV